MSKVAREALRLGEPSTAARLASPLRFDAGRVGLRLLKETLYWAALLIIVALVLIPFYWLVITSVKIPREVMSDPVVFFPSTLSFENFRRVMNIAGVWGFVLNSLVVSTGSTAAAVFLGSMAAYALAKSRLPWRLNYPLALWVLVTRMYPPITTAVPYFLLLRSLGLLDTRIGLVLTYVGTLLPLVIWMMYGFFRDIPMELEEAGLVDGCNMWQRFYQITLPLAAPALVATTILSFLTAWNEFLFALILSAVNAQTVPVSLATFLNEKGLEWGPMTALATIHAVPMLFLAFAAQRYLVAGLTLGAVKQ